MQCPSKGSKETTAAAAQSARAASARTAPPPQRQPARWRTSALHAQAGSRSGRQGWHVGAWPCTEEGRPLARAVPFHRARSDHIQRSVARVRGKHPCCASPPERGSAVAHKRATHSSRLMKWVCGWHVGARPSTEEARPLARAVPFHRATARAAPPQQRQPAQWRASQLTKRALRVARGSTAFHRRGVASHSCSALP